MNSVADDRTNAKAAHFPGCIGDDPTLIIEQNPEPAVRENFVDNSLYREQFFFRHSLSSLFAETARADSSWLAGVKDGESARAPKTVDTGW